MPKVVNNLNEASHEKEPVLRKHVGLIHSENKLSLLQRKICNILLFNALNNIQDDVHRISIRQLCSLIGYISNDVSLIKLSLKRLMSIVMEWNLLDDAKFINDKALPNELISWHASTLLSGASIEEGTLSYSYSPQIKAVLSTIEIYGRINLFVQSKFNSAYSLVLYENCVRFKNIGKTSWFDLKLFRTLMGVTLEKYTEFKELKRNVITPAVNEINKKSDINVEIEYRKIGRQITAIRFLIANNNNYKPQFRHVGTKESEVGCSSAMLHEILKSEFSWEDKLILQTLQQYDHAYILEKINFVKNQKNIANKSAYFQAALKNNYKKSEIANPSKPREVEATNSYLRDSREADKISGLHKKYITYRLSEYSLWLEQHVEYERIYSEFKTHLSKNQIIYELYRKKGLHAPMVTIELINFLEKNYKVELPACLSFEDYITEEEHV